MYRRLFLHILRRIQKIEKLKSILASFHKRQEKISAKNPSNGQNKMKQSRRGMNAEKSG